MASSGEAEGRGTGGLKDGNSGISRSGDGGSLLRLQLQPCTRMLYSSYAVRA